MNYKTHNDVEIKLMGTSYAGEIEIDYYDIIDRLGKPQAYDDYKTDVQWALEFEDGCVATLYNWKDGKNYCGKDGLFPYQIRTWMVGCKTKTGFNRIYKLFKGV